MKTMEQTARLVPDAKGLMIALQNGVNEFPVYGTVMETRDGNGEKMYLCGKGLIAGTLARWPERIVRKVLTAEEEAV